MDRQKQAIKGEEMLLVILDTDNICSLSIDDYLGKDFPCTCGKTHKVGIERIVVENGALQRIPDILAQFTCKKVLIVADTNTYKAAGMHVQQLLSDSCFICKTLVYVRDGNLVPDETAIGEFLIGVEVDTDIVIAVGSGVINDLAKYVSYRLSIPFIIVATAPSMDGFASDSSALVIDGLKTSMQAQTAKAIIADVDILKNAPMEMILAGLGDMLGKYSALRDWKLGNIVTGEYYCDTVAQMVRFSVQKCIDNINGFSCRDDLAIKSLMEGLIISGIAMSFVGNSRPASGSEHHISHYWEMVSLQMGKNLTLHGEQVGITSLAANHMAEVLGSTQIDLEAAVENAKSFDEQKWQADVERLFQKAAPGIIRESQEHNRNSLTERLTRVRAVTRNWGRIVDVLKEAASAAEVEAILKVAGAPTNPKDVGVDLDIVYDSIIYAKEVRSRYTILQMLWDLGLIEEFAEDVKDYYSC